jgi:hypothetical protein
MEDMLREGDITEFQDRVIIVLRPVTLLTKTRLQKLSSYCLLVTGPICGDWNAAAREIARMEFAGLKIELVRVEKMEGPYEVKFVEGRILKRSSVVLPGKRCLYPH